MDTRRAFLRTSVLGGAGLMAASLPGMAAMAQGSAAGGGYKALVCVFLAGGMDSHDAIIPADAPGYADHAGVRERLMSLYADRGDDSRTRGALRPLGTHGDGRAFGAVRQLGGLADRYADGDMAVIANVGPLEQATDRAQAEAGTARLPARLMSHNDQQSMWQALGTEGAETGWGGRLADAIGDAASPFTTVSLSGNPVYLAGNQVRPYQLGTNGVAPVRHTGERAYGSAEIAARMREHLTASAAEMNNLIAADYQAAHRRAVTATNELFEVMAGSTEGDAVRAEGNDLSNQLAMVAKTIALRSQTGLSRQVFFVQMGGFDTHADQFVALPELQAKLSEAMTRFHDWTVSAGLADAVTTFTASEFGRTLTTNATGTDHGWGGHHLVLGGAVRGGRIVGSIPPAVEGHDQDLGRGRMIPTLATEQYAGSLGRWFGLSDGQLRDVLPRWGRFDPDGAVLF